MSDLIKLNKIANQNGDIKAFSLSTNLKRARHGKGTFGEVTIAIDSLTVERIWQGDVIGVLYIVGKEEWQKD